LAGAPPPRMGAYFWRRGLRILPAYWVALTISVFLLDVPAVIPPAKDLVLYYGLVHLYSVDHVFGPILSSYTLVTEIAFYVFLPVYAFVVASRRDSTERQVRRDAIGLAALFTGGLAYRVVLAVAEPSAQRDFQLSNILPGWIDVFAVGMGLALVSAWYAHKRAAAPARLDHPLAPAVSWALCALSLVLVSVLIGRPSGNIEFSAGDKFAIHYLYLAVAFFLVLPAVFGPQDRGVIRGFLRNPVVQWLGLISYGLYLWNEPLIAKYLEWTDDPIFNTSFVKMMAAVTAMTVVASAISYFVVERPVLALKGRVPDRPPQAEERP
jgi:peptidoglycan/LPS O-acetylase OafA/YrhL